MAKAPARFDLEADWVSLGSGLGGVCSAIAACDAGGEAVILDKSPRLGGLSGFGGGEVFVPNNHKMRELGLEDSDAAGRAYLSFIAAGFQDPVLFDKLLATCKEAVEYFGREAGVPWIAVEGLPDYYYPKAKGSCPSGRYLTVELFEGATLGEWQHKTYPMTPHVPPGALHREMYAWGGLAKVAHWDYELIGRRIAEDKRSFGPGLMGWLVKAAVVDRKIPAFVHTAARELVTDESGAVVGVRAEREGRDFFLRARRGVVIAVGGYDHDRELARQFECMPDWNSAAPPYLHGDNIVMGTEVGAALAAVPPTNLALFYGYHIPGEETDGSPLYRASWECGVPHAIWVNRKGERFCDESTYKDYQPRLRQWDGQTQSMPNIPPFLIFDQNYRDRYPLGSFMPGQELPGELVEEADTPRELAAKLGIDPEGLERTLVHFNENARRGEDPDFQRGSFAWSARLVGDFDYPNPNLGPLDKPPFYGVRLVPVSVGINSHGLKTNEHAQVVHVRGHAIRGLYAVGNSAALRDLGAGYQSGVSNMRAITWGYIAGRHALGKG
jgi:3-oxosteroid 1-dehydrogenase